MLPSTAPRHGLEGQYIVTITRLHDSPSLTTSVNVQRGETPPLTASPLSATPSPLMLTPLIPAFQPTVAIQSPPYHTPVNSTPEHLVPPSLPPVFETHPVLILTSYRDHENSPFSWNLTVDPTSIRARHALRPQYAVPYTLMEAVTNPYMQNITIMCHTVPLPMRIDVPASANGHFVTVHDVLRCIYRYLRIPLSPQEYEKIKAEVDAGHLEAIIQAYEARYRTVIGDDAVKQRERQKGLKRIDMLTNQTLFMGLAPTNKPGEFIMRTGPL